MHETFSFSRFARLFVKHTAEHYRTYLMAMAVLTGFLVLSGSFLFLVDPDFPDPGFQEASYAIVLFVAGGLFASGIFTDYGDKNRAIPALTLPATTFEKFLVGWLWSYPIFLLVYTGVFYLALFGLSHIHHSVVRGHFIYFTMWQPEVSVMLTIFTELHALALFGAIFFKKLHFIRTGFAFFIAFAVVLLLNTLLLKILTGVQVVKAAIPFGYLNLFVGDRFYSINTGDRGWLPIRGLILVVAVLTWVAAYYRLKEKRV